MKTYSPKPVETKRDWHLIDAKDQVLGRLASKVAILLMGKHKVSFSRHLDMGDHVVVVNAKNIRVTGNKETQKEYHRHSGYPGGMKVTTLQEMRANHPDRVITHAVHGMLPDNKLQDKMLGHLHVFAGSEHPFTSNFKAK